MRLNGRYPVTPTGFIGMVVSFVGDVGEAGDGVEAVEAGEAGDFIAFHPRLTSDVPTGLSVT